MRENHYVHSCPRFKVSQALYTQEKDITLPFSIFYIAERVFASIRLQK